MSAQDQSELRALLAFQLVPGLGPRRAALLIAHFGSAAAVLRASPAALSQTPHIGSKLAGDLARGLAEADVAGELEKIDRAGVQILALGGPGYPEALATIPDPPQLLYVRGSITPDDARCVAIVGSRQCTDYGRRVTTQLARDLVKAGYTVISGLARGTDGAAHRAALQGGGRTLAVLANGLSRIYPPEHKDLATQVVQSGALLTENRMDEAPLKDLFPARNRIISGLAQAVIIVEAAERSGTLITATHAADQGRTVLAVPGPVDSAASAGTNSLIRKGAILCRGIDDVLEEILGVSGVMQRRGDESATAPREPAKPPPGLDAMQLSIWEGLGDGPCSLDELVQRLGLAAPQMSTTLLMLEMKKVVKRLPGNRYERY